MRASYPLVYALTALLFGCSTDEFASADGGDGGASVDGAHDAVTGDAGDAGAKGCVRSAPFGTPTVVVWRESANGAPSAFTGIVRFDRDEKRAVFDDGSTSGIYFADRDTDGFVGKTPYVAQPAGSSFHPALDGSGKRLFFAYQGGSNFVISTGPASGAEVPVLSAAVVTMDLKMPYPLPDDPSVLYAATGVATAAIYRFSLDDTGKATGEVVAPGSDKFKVAATSVVVSSDELELYFGTGNTPQTAAVYQSSRASTGAEWSSPKIVNFPNEALGETPTYLSGDGCRLYYRGYKAGQRALFVMKKPPK